MMARTFADMMNNVEAMLPSSTEFSYAQRSKWMYDVAYQNFPDFGVMKSADLLLSTSTNLFNLASASTQIALENVVSLYVTCTKTTCSTNITNATQFDEYKIVDIYDPVRPGYITFHDEFSDERMLRVFFLAIPALFPTTSSDSTTIVDMDPKALNAIEYGTVVRLCKAGQAPDVELANAYTIDYESECRRLKKELKNRNRKMANDPVSYKEWEWNA